MIVLFLGMTPSIQAVTQFHRDGTVLRLSNGKLATTFNLASGEWEALYNDGTVWATQLRCTLDAGGVSATIQGPPTFSIGKVWHTLGRGIRLEIERGEARPFVLVLTMYDDLPLFLVQVRVPNANGLQVKEVTLPEGKMYVGGAVPRVCAMVNCGTGAGYTEIHPVELTDRRNRWETGSQFYLGAFNRADERSVIVGTLCPQGLSRIEAEVDPERDRRAIFFKARWGYENPLRVEEGTWESPPYLISAPDNVFQGLEVYGAVARAYRSNPLFARSLADWSDWEAGTGADGKESFASGPRRGIGNRGGDLIELYPALKTWSRRYFINPYFWNDRPDLLDANLPTDEQSRVWASFVALAGGTARGEDSLSKLPPSRIAILNKARPAPGITARPCDLFEPPGGWAPKIPRIWDCKIKKPGAGAWDVVGLFNWTVDLKQGQVTWQGEPQNLTLDFIKHLELKPARRYLVYDFWRQEYLGAFEGGLRLGLAPASCRVLVLREEAGVPQVVGDDCHIISGAQALQQVRWEERTQILSGVLETARNIPYTLALHLPAGLAIYRAAAHGAPVPFRMINAYCAQIVLNTGSEGKVPWTVNFKRAATAPEATANSTLSSIEIPQPDPQAKEIPLRQLPPRWTDQRHDIVGGPIVSGGRPDLSATAPFWIHWDISKYSKTHRKLVADCMATGEGRLFFEVLGDGARLAATDLVQKGESVHLNVPIAGLSELTLICHYVDGMFCDVNGFFQNPRLVR